MAKLDHHSGFLFFSGALSIFITIGIVFFLSEEAVQFFRSPDVTLLEFLTGTKWQPHLGEFGILPLLNATLVTSFIAMLVAIPLGMCVAIYLSEYASPKTRGIIKPI
jgi:phosphate transport system permease protein